MSTTFSLRPAAVARRLARGEIYYAIGRFARVRRGYSRLRALLDWLPRNPSVPIESASLFPGLEPASTAAELAREGIVCGLALPDDILLEIARFAEERPFRPLQGGPPVLRREVRGGRLPNGEPAVVGRVIAPQDCPAVRRVAGDPALYALASRYLGYRPPIILSELHWSFVSDATSELRRKLGQTIDYHYDVGWFNFLYFFFYLTPVDRLSGAHAIIRRSHRRKPLSMLWHSARQPDEPVLRHYGPAAELVVEGPAGTGFVEDASCFHKALVPTAGERLAFFVRYG